MRGIKKYLILFMMCFLIGMGVNCKEAYAGVKVINWNLVDSKKHLDWDGSSKYMSYFKSAVNVWNNYKKGVIRKDNLFRQQDVVISDCFEISSTAGVTSKKGTIRFNKYVMDRFNEKAKKNVCIHELGHALGLGHNTKNDVMYKYVTTKTSLSTNDKKSYNYAYKYLYRIM